MARRLVSSPTIRLNGSNIAFDPRESHCPSYSENGGQATECRTWLFEGTSAPPRLIVEAILSALEQNPGPDGAATDGYALPENLDRFSAGRDPGHHAVCP